MLVQECLPPESIYTDIQAETVDEVLHLLANRLAEQLGADASTLVQAIQEREEVRSTALPNGGAIPHCRLGKLKKFGIAMLILQAPISWDEQNNLVDAVMMIAGPADQVPDHLRILANSSQLLDCPALRAKLKQAPDNGGAHRLICAAEEVIEERRHQHGMLREVRKEANGNGHHTLAEVVEAFQW